MGPPRMLRRRSRTLVLSVSISFSISVLWRLQSRVSQLKIVLAASKGARQDPKHPCRTMDQNRSPIPEDPVMGAEQCQGLLQNWSAGTLPAREQLGGCCNASADLVLTQNNTQLGSQIVYDAQRDKKHPVKEELLEMLPQVSPFQGAPYECCAVVGNGGILHNSGCGPEIDRAQFVIRFNLPPMDNADDVGTKSSVVTMNPSILHARFRGLSRWRRPFAEVVGAYGAPLLLIPAFSYVGQSTVSFQALYTLEDFGSPARAVFMNPEYLARLDGHWRPRGLRAKRLSSGFMLVSAALELCQHLTLYGFWPFPTDPEGRPLLHHYYDNQPPKPGAHAMPDEFTRYLGMHMQGALRLHLGRCR
ncbi:alpha-2,8-sialyltransferase 8E-like isoform X6 [Chrysemys picta bellii]|uniref:alpha-2,8-sialyltransferase 8E-like isoform X6 n=1 Tax=Chrysemys picta bellii TaxID=8478 RepID=UPI0032B0FDFF